MSSYNKNFINSSGISYNNIQCNNINVTTLSINDTLPSSIANLTVDENGILIYDTNTYLSESSLISALSSGTVSVILQNLQVNSNTTLNSLTCNGVNYSNIFSIDTSTNWLNINTPTVINGPLTVQGLNYGSIFSIDSSTNWLDINTTTTINGGLNVQANTVLNGLIANGVNYSNYFSVDSSTEWLNINSTTNLNGNLNVSENFTVNGVDYGSNFSVDSTIGWLQLNNSIVFHDNVNCDSNFILSSPAIMSYTTLPYLSPYQVGYLYISYDISGYTTPISANTITSISDINLQCGVWMVTVNFGFQSTSSVTLNKINYSFSNSNSNINVVGYSCKQILYPSLSFEDTFIEQLTQNFTVSTGSSSIYFNILIDYTGSTTLTPYNSSASFTALRIA
jgi:hypothetical protein